MGAPQWMVIGAASDSELATAKASGMTHGLVEVKWDQVQPTNGAVDASGVLANISRIISAGMKVILRVSPQYIPSFVDTAAVKFRRNGSVNWTGVNADGNNIRDWVWSVPALGPWSMIS
jgi:beta-galactosidase GanA